jgi:hypothetical protein
MIPMINADHVQLIQQKFLLLQDDLNERSLRHWAAAEALTIGYRGITIVSQGTALAHNTIRTGIRELQQKHLRKEAFPPDRIRHPGGGRKKLTQNNPRLLPALNALVDPVTRGDPESPLLWTSKSAQKLTDALVAAKYKVSERTVNTLLNQEGFSLQSNRKRHEGGDHPDRDAQFTHIYETVKSLQQKNQPVISVDTKKKELIGNFRNSGKEWERKGKPVDVNVYDFVNKELGKAIPYGVYDIMHNEGWVSVGIDHDTAQFAVASIRTWWEQMGKKRYPAATEILITADGGGSNSRRIWLWKAELQHLANELGLTIHVCHFPPGTSKWNKIEHRMFSFISKNWRGKPLLDRATVVNLIANTRTKTGLRIDAALDTNTYKTGIKVSNEIIQALNLYRDPFHGEWNYRLEPQR